MLNLRVVTLFWLALVLLAWALPGLADNCSGGVDCANTQGFQSATLAALFGGLTVAVLIGLDLNPDSGEASDEPPDEEDDVEILTVDFEDFGRDLGVATEEIESANPSPSSRSIDTPLDASSDTAALPEDPTPAIPPSSVADSSATAVPPDADDGLELDIVIPEEDDRPVVDPDDLANRRNGE